MTLSSRAHPLLRSWRVRAGEALAIVILSSGTAAAQAPLRPAAPARPTATPAAKPATPIAKPATPAARPATPAARPTTPAPRPAAPAPRPAPRPPVGDVGPPPTLPDVGPPPSLPSTDAPVIGPSATPTTPAPAKPTGPAPQRATPTVAKPAMRPTSPPPLRPTAPAPIPAPAPPARAPIPAPAPPASTAIPEPGVPVAPPPVLTDPPVPADSSAPAPAGPTADPKLRAPVIGEEPASDAPKPLTAADIEALAEQKAKEERKNPKKWRHGGLILDLQIGTAGCFRQFCRSDSGHNAAPGVHLGAFFGGNVFGILEIGLEAGWNTLRPKGVEGRNAVTLYGLDPALLQQAIAEQQGVISLDVDFSNLAVTSASSRALNIGPSLRIHFIRKGRGIAYVGTGIHYQRWRNRYETTGGPLRLDFHGLTVPFKIGGGAYVHPNIAVVGEFTYSLAYYVLGGVDHPNLSAVAPLSIIESTATDAGASLMKGLPHFGKFSVNLRFRF